MNDRKYSAKYKNNELISTNDYQMFQYNISSIIDLKLFPKNNEEEENNFLYSNYSTENQFNNLNQKKYLINKNIRFYQPIKDAEMLVQLDSLRMKLQASNSNNMNNNNNELNQKPSSNLKKSIHFNSNESIHADANFNCKNCLSCKEEENRKLQYMKLVQNEILKGKGDENDSFSLKSYNLSGSKKSTAQTPDFEFYNNQIMPEIETIEPLNKQINETNNNYREQILLRNSVLSDKNNNNNNNAVEFPELKKFSINKFNSKNRIKSSIRREKSATTDKISIPKPKTLATNLLPTTQEISSATIKLLKSKNVQKIVRKSTQSRLKNIYKYGEQNIDIVNDLRAKTPKTEYNSVHECYLPPTVSFLDIHAPTMISFLDIRDTNSETNKSLSSKILLNQPKIINNTNYNTKKYQSTFIINDFIDFSRIEQLRKNGLKGRLNDKSKSNFIDLIPNQNKISIKASN